MNPSNNTLDKDMIKKQLELYIQMSKIIDGKKKLDEKSLNTLNDRLYECFKSKLDEYDEDKIKDFLNAISIFLELNLEKVIEILKEKFNEQHNRLQTANTYSAIDYDNKSVIREVFQNIFDRPYDGKILINMIFDDLNNAVTIHYNEPGFDLKSLIFYFSAGDSAKNDMQTGKFGLGIKSVMYNVKNLTCLSSFGDKIINWYVEKEESYENKDEVKKKLFLKNLDFLLSIPFKGTSLTISLEEDEYKKIQENFYSINKGSGEYLDIPELIFALSSSKAKELELNINGCQKYEFSLNDSRNKCNLTSNGLNLSFGIWRPNKAFIKELLYLNTEVDQHIFSNCYSLYATYKMIEDKTLDGREGNFFISVKNNFVISSRKALKNADQNKKLILEEAENFISDIANSEENKNLFKVEIVDTNDNLNVVYSPHLKKFMSFSKSPKFTEALFKNIKCPNETSSGRRVNYYYHSAIAKVGHSLYANSSDFSYNSNSIPEHQQVNRDINFFIGKIDNLLAAEDLNIIIDLFNANYNGTFIDFTNISIVLKGEINDLDNIKIKEMIQLTYAPKASFADDSVYGNRGSICYYKDYSYFKKNTIQNIFQNKTSYYKILSEMNIKSKFELDKCYEVLKILNEKYLPEVDPADYNFFENEENELLNEKFSDAINSIKIENLKRILKKNDEITFSELMKYISVINIEEVALNKNFDLELDFSFKDKFLPKNQERLEKIVGANSNVENFTESNINTILGKIFICENKIESKDDYFLLIDKNNQITKIKKEENLKKFVANGLLSYNPFLNLSEFIDTETRLIWFTKKKRVVSDIEEFIDAYLKVLGKNGKNLRGFSSINEIKTKTLHTDQLAQKIKLYNRIQKNSLVYMEEEIKRRLDNTKEEQMEKVSKTLIYRDFSSELYGNGYCCTLKNCDFDVANEYAYDILNLEFQNYKLPVFVCQNHKMILSNNQIHINRILIGDKDISELFKYIDSLSDNEFINPIYQNVSIRFTQKFNTESFRPDLDSNDKDEEYTFEDGIRLSPVNLALWYFLNR